VLGVRWVSNTRSFYETDKPGYWTELYLILMCQLTHVRSAEWNIEFQYYFVVSGNILGATTHSWRTRISKCASLRSLWFSFLPFHIAYIQLLQSFIFSYVSSIVMAYTVGLLLSLVTNSLDFLRRHHFP
jgi:hypothetical protein